MKEGRYFRIPESAVDLERLWSEAEPLEQGTLPEWLPPEDAGDYRLLGLVATNGATASAEYARELEEAEAAGLIVVPRGNRSEQAVYVEVPFDEVWSIGIYEGPSPVELAPARGLESPVLTRSDVTDVPAVSVADPFLSRRGGSWFMFFEVFDWRANKGEIALAVSDDTRNWTYERVVLREEFHLSYPHVFAVDGEIYLLPESHQAGELRLYRATDFPTAWSHEATLLSGRYVDASPFRHAGGWWLFADTDPEECNDTVRLFRAAELTGEWREHPCSPVIAGDTGAARPAGRVVRVGGAPVRFAQDCAERYGGAVRAFRIDELSPTTYRETPLGRVLGPGRGWNEAGMHHVDAHQLDEGTWLACVDGAAEPLR